MREDHYASLSARKFKTLAQARAAKLPVDWKTHNIPTPKLLGTKTYLDYDLAELVPYIDWNPFFQVWQLRGKYPNRGYPKIFNDETVGEEAKKLHDDAVAMLDEIVKNKTLKAKGVVGIWPANATGDDIEVYAADGSGAQLGTFYTLRQQEENEDYKGIMMEAIADRLAEAFAELIHAKMRKELWGYAPDEALDHDDLLKVKYQGIRPAPGYPTQP